MRLLRRAGLLFGFGVLGLLGATEYALSRRDGAKPGPIDDSDIGYVSADSVSSPSRAVARLRVVLGALGVAIAVFGGYVVLRDVATASYLGLAIWLAAAIVLHDFVLVPLLTGLRALSRRVGRRLPVAAVRLAEAGFLVGGVITLLAVPEIYAQSLGTLNPTVLPGSYGQSLLLTWVVLAVLTALAVTAVSLRARRRVTPGAQLSR